MGFTRPQHKLIRENKKILFSKFAKMIEASPNSLIQILDDARGAGLSEDDLIGLLGKAQSKGHINVDQFKKYAQRYQKTKTGRIRRTGKTRRSDVAFINDQDKVGDVTCAFCKDSVPAHRASLVSGGAWMCNICSGD